MTAVRHDDAARRGPRGLRGWQIWSLPPPASAYIVTVTGLAVLAAAAAAARSHWQLHEAVVYAALLGCGVVAIESTRNAREIHGTIGRDLQTVWYLTIAVTLPPVCAFLAPVPFAAWKLWRVRRGFVYRRVFSNATLSLAYGSASLLFHHIRSTPLAAAPGADFTALSWTAVVAGCGVMAWVINNGLLLTAVRLTDSHARIRHLIGGRDGLVLDLAELGLAVTVALVVAITPFLMVLALPLVTLYRSYLISRQLGTVARIDARTGLLTAGTWQHEADVEFLRARHARAPLALAMVGIDHFSDLEETTSPLVRD